VERAAAATRRRHPRRLTMPNGKPGDHPVTDVLIHGNEAISPRVSELIAEIARVGGRDALRPFDDDLLALDADVRFGLLREGSVEAMERRLADELDRLRADAVARGWETGLDG